MMQVCDKVPYLQFARDDGGCHYREDKIRVVPVLLFRRENKVVVAVEVCSLLQFRDEK